jgi:hypothetical protein
MFLFSDINYERDFVLFYKTIHTYYDYSVKFNVEKLKTYYKESWTYEKPLQEVSVIIKQATVDIYNLFSNNYLKILNNYLTTDAIKMFISKVLFDKIYFNDD